MRAGDWREGPKTEGGYSGCSTYIGIGECSEPRGDAMRAVFNFVRGAVYCGFSVEVHD